jgi:hypothetical protein
MSRLSSIGFDSIHSARIVAPSFSNKYPENKNKKKGKGGGEFGFETSFTNNTQQRNKEMKRKKTQHKLP